MYFEYMSLVSETSRSIPNCELMGAELVPKGTFAYCQSFVVAISCMAWRGALENSTMVSELIMGILVYIL